MDRRNSVILVDRNDRKIGIEEKMKAHDIENGRFHRALSVFVFNKRGETMLQQRAMDKYHSKGRWSNTCCSHPMPGEQVITAAHRRLQEEMGFDCKMWQAFDFPYEANVGNGLREREYDHVIFGRYDKEPKLNKDEVMGWKWMEIKQLQRKVKQNPKNFTPWLVLMIDELVAKYGKMKSRMDY